MWNLRRKWKSKLTQLKCSIFICIYDIEVKGFFLSYINSSLFFKKFTLFIIGKEGNKENIRKTVHFFKHSTQICENLPTRRVKLKNVALFMFIFPPFFNPSLNGSIKRAKVRAAEGQNLLDQGWQRHCGQLNLWVPRQLSVPALNVDEICGAVKEAIKRRTSANSRRSLNGH